jgi:hypothetical protein
MPFPPNQGTYAMPFSPSRMLLIAGVGLLLVAAKSSAQDADGTIKLFNGTDLTNFYTYLAAPKKGDKPYGRNNDPEKVFSVHDGMIHVTGKVWGCFTTEKEYDNYHLTVEFKWGDKTWGERELAARDSGVLLHCVGEDGGFGPWMESYECQMIEGGTGDFLVLGRKHPFRLTVEAEDRPTGDGGKQKQPYFKPGAEAREFAKGRINWFGRDPQWKDVKGFRGPQDVEKPVGEWNMLECVCAGDTITNILNGTVVNKGTKANVTRGKILFQSEGAEVFFRRIDLKPLPK